MTVRPLLCAAALFAAWAAPANAAPQGASVEISAQRILDMAELEVSFDTVRAEYYRRPNPQVLLDGARIGIVAYLRRRGIASPVLAYPHATGVYAHDLHELDAEIYGAYRRFQHVIELHPMIQRAIAGELAALDDPYTIFFVPREYHDFVASLSGRPRGGIGGGVGVKGGVAVVDHPIAQSPAARAGLRAGDAIVAVDGVSIKDLSADAFADRIRGPAGSTVTISVVRDGVALPQPLQIVRAEVKQPDVDARMLAGGVGYVALAAYGEDSAHELVDALKDLDGQGAHAYVLDLRDNGGGYARQAVTITSHFIDGGPVFTVQRRSGRRTTYYAEPATTPRKPLAVLVNGNTASAAEITAAAIADDRTGTLIGERTFGKGVAQEVFVLPSGGAMKMTTERYFTAAGHDIDRKGIVPDIAVAEPSGAVRGVAGQDPQLDRALALLAPPVAP